jgi:hypothetical protein
VRVVEPDETQASELSGGEDESQSSEFAEDEDLARYFFSTVN